MGLGFKGGLAAFAKGAQQGADRAREIEKQERNAAWLESERKETTAKLAREEETRQKMTQVGKDRMESVEQAGPGLQMPDGTEGAMAPIQVARKATQDETLRDLSAVQRGAGNIEGALTSTQAADTYVDTQRKKFDADLADAVSRGDAGRITEVINSVGKNRIAGQVVINPFERDLPGYGKVPTFNATFKVQDPSGKVVEQTINSHDLQTRLQPYSAQMDTRLKAQEAKRRDEEGAAKNNYYNSFAEQKAALAAGGGKALGMPRADHFDARQWDAAGKIDKSVVSLPNELSGKDVESVDLRSTYMRVFNAAKAGGVMAPNEAAEHATTTIAKVKAVAAARVERALEADPKSRMTLDGAIREILKESAKFQPKPAPAAPMATPPGPTNSTEADMKRSAQLSPAELARSSRIEGSPEMLAAIDREISITRAPEALRILRDERAKVQQRIAANSAAQ